MSYGQIALQMVVLGSGLGLTTAPATESIMGVVRPEQAGVGSAVNDATRELGGTLGVAVIGSVYASLYRRSLDTGGLPGPVRAAARSSYAAARSIADQLPTQAAQLLTRQADAGFLSGLHAGCRVGAGVCAAGMLAVLAFLPARPQPAPAGRGQQAWRPACGRSAASGRWTRCWPGRWCRTSSARPVLRRAEQRPLDG